MAVGQLGDKGCGERVCSKDSDNISVKNHKDESNEYQKL